MSLTLWVPCPRYWHRCLGEKNRLAGKSRRQTCRVCKKNFRWLVKYLVPYVQLRAAAPTHRHQRALINALNSIWELVSVPTFFRCLCVLNSWNSSIREGRKKGSGCNVQRDARSIVLFAFYQILCRKINDAWTSSRGLFMRVMLTAFISFRLRGQKRIPGCENGGDRGNVGGTAH